jgi:hypothetical protein
MDRMFFAIFLSFQKYQFSVNFNRSIGLLVWPYFYHWSSSWALQWALVPIHFGMAINWHLPHLAIGHWNLPLFFNVDYFIN